MRAPLAFAAAALLFGAVASPPAQAACKRFGFLVNDYGKEGPTKDAKDLLDKNISEWSAKSGIKDYSVGPKTVSCYQFLNFIVFDEHTCTASATVCWGPDKKTTDGQAATGAPPTPVRKTAAAEGSKKAHKQKAAAPAEAAPAAAEQDPMAAAAMPNAGDAPTAAGTETAPQEAAPADSAGAPLETGSTGTADTAPPSVEAGALGAAAPPETPAPSSAATNKARAAEAASAAAAAAERAAAAAEIAANAAKEAAAAAVAASAAGRGSFVPPLGEAMEAQKAKSTHALGDAR